MNKIRITKGYIQESKEEEHCEPLKIHRIAETDSELQRLQSKSRNSLRLWPQFFLWGEKSKTYTSNQAGYLLRQNGRTRCGSITIASANSNPSVRI
jgi:hypothetical protein